MMSVRHFFRRLVDAMIERNEVEAALKVYGYKDLPEFEKAYSRYRKHF